MAAEAAAAVATTAVVADRNLQKCIQQVSEHFDIMDSLIVTALF